MATSTKVILYVYLRSESAKIDAHFISRSTARRRIFGFGHSLDDLFFCDDTFSLWNGTQIIASQLLITKYFR